MSDDRLKKVDVLVNLWGGAEPHVFAFCWGCAEKFYVGDSDNLQDIVDWATNHEH